MAVIQEKLDELQYYPSRSLQFGKFLDVVASARTEVNLRVVGNKVLPQGLQEEVQQLRRQLKKAEHDLATVNEYDNPVSGLVTYQRRYERMLENRDYYLERVEKLEEEVKRLLRLGLGDAKAEENVLNEDVRRLEEENELLNRYINDPENGYIRQIELLRGQPASSKKDAAAAESAETEAQQLVAALKRGHEAEVVGLQNEIRSRDTRASKFADERDNAVAQRDLLQAEVDQLRGRRHSPQQPVQRPQQPVQRPQQDVLAQDLGDMAQWAEKLAQGAGGVPEDLRGMARRHKRRASGKRRRARRHDGPPTWVTWLRNLVGLATNIPAAVRSPSTSPVDANHTVTDNESSADEGIDPAEDSYRQRIGELETQNAELRTRRQQFDAELRNFREELVGLATQQRQREQVSDRNLANADMDKNRLRRERSDLLAKRDNLQMDLDIARKALQDCLSHRKKSDGLQVRHFDANPSNAGDIRALTRKLVGQQGMNEELQHKPEQHRDELTDRLRALHDRLQVLYHEVDPRLDPEQKAPGRRRSSNLNSEGMNADMLFEASMDLLDNISIVAVSTQHLAAAYETRVEKLEIVDEALNKMIRERDTPREQLKADPERSVSPKAFEEVEDPLSRADIEIQELTESFEDVKAHRNLLEADKSRLEAIVEELSGEIMALQDKVLVTTAQTSSKLDQLADPRDGTITGQEETIKTLRRELIERNLELDMAKEQVRLQSESKTDIEAVTNAMLRNIGNNQTAAQFAFDIPERLIEERLDARPATYLKFLLRNSPKEFAPKDKIEAEKRGTDQLRSKLKDCDKHQDRHFKDIRFVAGQPGIKPGVGGPDSDTEDEGAYQPESYGDGDEEDSHAKKGYHHISYRGVPSTQTRRVQLLRLDRRQLADLVEQHEEYIAVLKFVLKNLRRELVAFGARTVGPSGEIEREGYDPHHWDYAGTLGDDVPPADLWPWHEDDWDNPPRDEWPAWYQPGQLPIGDSLTVQEMRVAMRDLERDLEDTREELRSRQEANGETETEIFDLGVQRERLDIQARVESDGEYFSSDANANTRKRPRTPSASSGQSSKRRRKSSGDSAKSSSESENALDRWVQARIRQQENTIATIVPSTAPGNPPIGEQMPRAEQEGGDVEESRGNVFENTDSLFQLCGDFVVAAMSATERRQGRAQVHAGEDASESYYETPEEAILRISNAMTGALRQGSSSSRHSRRKEEGSVNSASSRSMSRKCEKTDILPGADIVDMPSNASGDENVETGEDDDGSYENENEPGDASSQDVELQKAEKKKKRKQRAKDDDTGGDYEDNLDSTSSADSSAGNASSEGAGPEDAPPENALPEDIEPKKTSKKKQRNQQAKNGDKDSDYKGASDDISSEDLETPRKRSSLGKNRQLSEDTQKRVKKDRSGSEDSDKDYENSDASSDDDEVGVPEEVQRQVVEELAELLPVATVRPPRRPPPKFRVTND
ncbi:hypothetical protein BJ878DRAFT_481507 [Calycina marina]|uniref:Uncharacterized protein n=1 Tax=Calycina marina TaxID=1763456 RepID=A0A9P7Z046_9HELO|nr:hypothetical protein BJ878DRAFT_481507 [Calycina marina]